MLQVRQDLRKKLSSIRGIGPMTLAAIDAEVERAFQRGREYEREVERERLAHEEDWAEHCRLANEPEGRTTGLHRDSMG